MESDINLGKSMALNVVNKMLMQRPLGHKMVVESISLDSLLALDWPVGLVVRDPDY